MAPDFSVVMSVIDQVNAPFSIGWTNADHPWQLARAFFNEETQLSDLHVFILYVNLLHPNNLFPRGMVVGRWQTGAGLHYERADGRNYAIPGREQCSIGLEAPANLTLCCETGQNVVEFFCSGARRAVLPCPFELNRRPGWPHGEIASNRVFALTMSHKRPEVALIPDASQV